MQEERFTPVVFLGDTWLRDQHALLLSSLISFLCSSPLDQSLIQSKKDLFPWRPAVMYSKLPGSGWPAAAVRSCLHAERSRGWKMRWSFALSTTSCSALPQWSVEGGGSCQFKFWIYAFHQCSVWRIFGNSQSPLLEMKKSALGAWGLGSFCTGDKG